MCGKLVPLRLHMREGFFLCISFWKETIHKRCIADRHICLPEPNRLHLLHMPLSLCVSFIGAIVAKRFKVL